MISWTLNHKISKTVQHQNILMTWSTIKLLNKKRKISMKDKHAIISKGLNNFKTGVWVEMRRELCEIVEGGDGYLYCLKWFSI